MSENDFSHEQRQCGCHWGIKTSLGWNQHVYAKTRCDALRQFGRLMVTLSESLPLADVAKVKTALDARPQFRRCPECSTD